MKISDQRRDVKSSRCFSNEGLEEVGGGANWKDWWPSIYKKTCFTVPPMGNTLKKTKYLPVSPNSRILTTEIQFHVTSWLLKEPGLLDSVNICSDLEILFTQMLISLQQPHSAAGLPCQNKKWKTLRNVEYIQMGMTISAMWYFSDPLSNLYSALYRNINFLYLRIHYCCLNIAL